MLPSDLTIWDFDFLDARSCCFGIQDIDENIYTHESIKNRKAALEHKLYCGLYFEKQSTGLSWSCNGFLHIFFGRFKKEK